MDTGRQPAIKAVPSGKDPPDRMTDHLPPCAAAHGGRSFLSARSAGGPISDSPGLLKYPVSPPTWTKARGTGP